MVERTNKAEIRPEEESENTESCKENLWNKIQLKGPQRGKIDTGTELRKRSEQGRLVYVFDVNRNVPTT